VSVRAYVCLVFHAKSEYQFKTPCRI